MHAITNSLTKLRVTLLCIAAAASLLAAAWLLVPAPAGLEAEWTYSPLGTPITLVDTVLALGGALLFVLALRKFKPELKPAYRLIAIAQLSVGLLTLVFPYIEYYDLWGSTWWAMSSYLAYFVGCIFMYLGTRRFLHVLKLKSRLASLPIIVGIILVLWGLHAVMPHVNSWEGYFGETQYDLFEIVPLLPVILYMTAAYFAVKIRSSIGVGYRKAFTWLAIGLGLQALAAITIAVLEVVGYENWYYSSRAYTLPVIIGDLGILGAAYYFNAIGLTAGGKGSFWSKLFSSKQAQVNSFDIIAYVAGLASEKQKIDPQLDKLRLISSKLQPGQQIAATDQIVLKDVYVVIEDYLVKDDPLRAFDRKQLQQSISEHFSLDGDRNDTFWPMVRQK